MENFSLLLQIYYRPAAAMSDILDKGSWLFAAIGVLIVAFALQYGINARIAETYSVNPYYSNFEALDFEDTEPGGPASETAAAERSANPDYDGRRSFPIAGQTIFWLFSFYSSFISPLIVLSMFYIPGLIILITALGRLGNVGVVFNRDYGSFSTCALMAWIAAHTPFAVAGLVLATQPGGGPLFLGMWLGSGLLFGVFMVFALRTVFGADYAIAGVAVAFSWIFYSAGVIVLQFISPWLFSPFLIIFAVLFFGGVLRSGVSGLGDAMRRKRDFKRYLQSATINPNDADAHVQLGLIYLARRQDEKALEHFSRAYEIDNEEIDANYELGRIARRNGELQKAIEHFGTVVAQNEKYSLSEVWREIGVTYLEANMPDEAEEPLEKFVKRRPFDSEGLYHYGVLLKMTERSEEANEMFERAVEASRTAPYHRRRELVTWAKKAKKELS